MMIDLETFDSAKAMMQSKFEKIIGYYLEDARSYVDAIKIGLEKQDAEMIVPAAHTIKSSSRQIGTFTIAGYAAGIEELGRACLLDKKRFGDLIKKSEYLEKIFNETEQEIKKHL
jgi:HPt (histidine-containing phosphotransfer) domain-containing protein